MTSASVAAHTEAHARHDEPPFKIVINEKHFEVDHRFRTGLELKALAAIPAQNGLFLEVPGPTDDEPIRDEFALPMQDGLRFYDVPVGNLGAR